MSDDPEDPDQSTDGTDPASDPDPGSDGTGGTSDGDDAAPVDDDPGAGDDPDGEGDPGHDGDAGGDTDPDTDGDPEPDTNGDADTDGDPEPDTDGDADSEPDGDADSEPDGDADSEPDTDGDADSDDVDDSPFAFGEDVPPVENRDAADGDGSPEDGAIDGTAANGEDAGSDAPTGSDGATGNGDDPDAGGLRKVDRSEDGPADPADHPRAGDRRDPIDPAADDGDGSRADGDVPPADGGGSQADDGGTAADDDSLGGGTVPESNVEFDDDEVAQPVADPEVTVADPTGEEPGSVDPDAEGVDGQPEGVDPDAEFDGSHEAVTVGAEPEVEAQTDPEVAADGVEIEREAEVDADAETHPGGGDGPGVDADATVPPDNMAEPVPGPATDPEAEPEGPPDDEEMPLAEHIEEMVSRLGVVVVAVAAATALAFPFAEQVLVTMWYDALPATASDPHIYGPLEKILAEIKVASLAGVLVALPVLVYQSYLFMRPGLYPKERRYFLAAVPTSLVLGAIGMAFAYFLILPVLFRYFVFYSKEGVDKLAFGLRVTFDLIVAMLGAFALVFQIPLLIMLAIMMGVTSRRWLEQRRLYFWGGFLGLGFLMGGADLTGMAPIIIAATMIGLFEGTLLLLRWTQR